jgi:hypothetical protein
MDRHSRVAVHRTPHYAPNERQPASSFTGISHRRSDLQVRTGFPNFSGYSPCGCPQKSPIAQQANGGCRGENKVGVAVEQRKLNVPNDPSPGRSAQTLRLTCLDDLSALLQQPRLRGLAQVSQDLGSAIDICAHKYPTYWGCSASCPTTSVSCARLDK